MADASAQPASAAGNNLMTRIAAWIRANGVRTAAEIVVNFALPLILYRVAKPHLGDVGALMSSSAPPLGWSIFEFLRSRRIDALSLIVLTGIALSLLAFMGGGGVRFLQLREQLVTGLVGMIFLGSAAIGRPLIYHLARARNRRAGAEAIARLESVQDSNTFRRTMTLATLAWGFGLTLECALACVLVFALTIPQFLAVSPILGTTTVLGLTAWTYWYVRRRITPLVRAAEGK
ncbi:MAG TPA: VC0807 family protein [Caulobacteraceae bacterium]|nr:VC0807 family protein [Caulobacteraceae bacterium]